jgi:hypothetical protein
MALKDTWTDKRDGIDDILAEDINGIAKAVIDIEETGGTTFPNASYETKPISLLDLTTSSTSDKTTITENQLIVKDAGVSTYIDFKGRADIEISSTMGISLYVDGERVALNKREISWSGIVSENLRVFKSGGGYEATITFNKFIGTIYTDGLMTGEQAEKLENTYTREESDSRFAENKVASETMVETTLEQLYNEGKAVTTGAFPGGNTWYSILGELTLNINGRVAFEVSENENIEVLIDGVQYTNSSFDGIVENGVKFVVASVEYGTITLSTLSIAEYSGGILSKKQVMKLENTLTKTEVENLITEAFGTVEAVFDEVHEYAENLIGGDSV